MGGNISNHFAEWVNITKDTFVLDIVRSGLKIDFFKKPVCYNIKPSYSMSDTEKDTINSEIEKLWQKRNIVPTSYNKGDFVSNIFTRPKSDGSYRFILNLKNLNEFVTFQHCKLESFKDVLDMITPGAWMSSVDLKDAYFSIAIHKDFIKFLKLLWEGKYFAFQCLPNGYGPALRMFTKILKQPFGYLRSLGHQSVVYVDESFLQGHSFEACQENVSVTVHLLQKLGFTVHPDKSILIPTQIIVFLGFVINSLDMTISLTLEKIGKILHMVRHILVAEYITIRAVASCIGLLVSSFPAVQFGPLYYRYLEICKNRALYRAKGNFDTSIVLTVKAFSELSWWLDNVQTVSRPIKTPSIDLTVYSDASLEGWGGTDLHSTVDGRWSVSELALHINTLELHAAKLCLFSLAAGLSNLHIRILLDNTTAISYINHMGGTHSQICNDVTSLIWSWCKDKGIWLSAAHIPGHENFIADYKSRHFQDNKEWSLNFSAFLSLTQLFYFPEIDLFASRLNHVVPKFVSYKPEPGAWATDAFSLNWHSLQFYAFPPFSIIGKVLAKIKQDEARGILIVPLWSTQPWFPTAMSLIVSRPILLKAKRDLLYLPGRSEMVHPLHKHLNLLAILVSGRRSEVLSFQRTLGPSLIRHGQTPPNVSTPPLCENGCHIAQNDLLIPLLHL